jgi:hypothetical protein
MNYVQFWEDMMTAIDIQPELTPRTEAGPAEPIEWATGFIETARIVGLRLAGFEAWAAGACALVAIGILVGLGELAFTLINPAMQAVMPVDCGSSVDCAVRTMGFLP